jgi:hypothetical protein
VISRMKREVNPTEDPTCCLRDSKGYYLQWATKLLQCFAHLNCLLHDYWSKIAKTMKKYELESPSYKLSDDMQVDYIISIFGQDITESIERWHCNSFVADTFEVENQCCCICSVVTLC